MYMKCVGLILMHINISFGKESLKGNCEGCDIWH